MKSFLISAWLAIVLTLMQKVNGDDWDSQSWATRLINAVFSKDENLVKRRLDNGADANETTGSGYTALMYASMYGTEKMVELLVPKSDAKASNNEGKTALMYAARFGNKKMVELLLPNSDAKASNKDGQTTLMYAAQYGNKDLLELLLSKSDAKATDKQGYTALMYSAFYGTERMVEILLPKSDVNARNNHDGKTALLYAARRYGTNKITEGNGNTILDLAKSFGNSQIVSFLQQYNGEFVKKTL